MCIIFYIVRHRGRGCLSGQALLLHSLKFSIKGIDICLLAPDSTRRVSRTAGALPCLIFLRSQSVKELSFCTESGVYRSAAGDITPVASRKRVQRYDLFTKRQNLSRGFFNFSTKKLGDVDFCDNPNAVLMNFGKKEGVCIVWGRGGL